MFLDMSSIIVEASNFTRAGRTCRAAMGFSFAAGTTDGAHQEHFPSRFCIHVLQMFLICSSFLPGKSIYPGRYCGRNEQFALERHAL